MRLIRKQRSSIIRQKPEKTAKPREERAISDEERVLHSLKTMWAGVRKTANTLPKQIRRGS